MRITIDSSSVRPIYKQIADGIKLLIARCTLDEGAMLPPVRQLAGDLDVNLNTVATAYRELETDGLIVIRHGSGARVSSCRSKGVGRADLRRSMVSLLADMVLTGMTSAEIDSAVRAALQTLSPSAG